MSVKKLSVVFVILAAFVFSACTTFQMTDAAYIKNQPAGTKVLGEFSTSVWVNQFLGGSGGAKLFNISADQQAPVIKAAIEAEISKLGGDAAINITITEQVDFGQMLLNGFSATIYAPVSVIITGVVIKY